MINPTGNLFSAAIVAALATGAATVPCRADDPPSCRDTDPHIRTGTVPVYSYWCAPTTSGHDGKVQLDIYVIDERSGPYYLDCSVPPLPQSVHDAFCGP